MVTVVQGKVCAKNHPDCLSRLATIHQRYRRTDFLWHRPRPNGRPIIILNILREIRELSSIIFYIRLSNISTVTISRSRNVRACLKTDSVGRLKLPWMTLNSSMMLFLHHVFLSEQIKMMMMMMMFNEGADKFCSLISGSIPMVLMFITLPSSLLLTI